VTYRRGFGLDDCIYCILYIRTIWHYGQCRAIAILHTFSSSLLMHWGSQFSLVVSGNEFPRSSIASLDSNLKSHM
jgi:hypothetical protein